MDKALIKALGNIKHFARKAMFMPKKGAGASSKMDGTETPNAKNATEEAVEPVDNHEEEAAEPKRHQYTLISLSGPKSSDGDMPMKKASKKFKNK